MMEYHIPELAWKKILEFLKKCPDIQTDNEFSIRLFVESIWYIARTGCQWRLLPSIYGKWNSIYKRFKRWLNKGIIEKLFQYFRTNSDTEFVMIDATIVRAQACAAGYRKDSQTQEALGRSRGGFSTKIHALVDALGNPLDFILTGGQRNEITQAENLIRNVYDATVIADRGYDSDAFVNHLSVKNCDCVIPPRKNRKYLRPYDAHTYKERHLIECFFGKIKYFRRIFSRFDKTASSYLGFLQFVSVLIWLR